MKVSDIILQIRSKLNDVTPINYKWSNEELIDNINSSLVQLSIKLILSSNSYTVKLQENKNRYKLPYNIQKIGFISIDDSPITIKSLDWIQSNTMYSSDIIFARDEESFFLFPKDNITNDMSLEMSYKYIQQIQKIEDEIKIPLEAKDALLFYAVHLSLQKNVSDKNEKRSFNFLNLYKDQIAIIKPTIFSQKQSKKIRSKYKKV